MIWFRAIRELRRNLIWHGVFLCVRSYGWWKFLRHPAGLYQRACAMSDGAFL